MENNNNGIKRKCACCGEYFYISDNNIENAIYYDNKTYHSSCFISMCEKRSKMKREDISRKWKCIIDILPNIKQDSYENFNLAITKNNIFNFIRESYDIKIIPTTIWHKLASIYNGTFKGMGTGIPPSHLLDMWKRKIDMLNGIAYRNKTKGKTMSVEQRINYDLTVLINKYDSYLKWLEKQKIIETEKEVETNENIVRKNIRYISEKNNDTYSEDISDLVDDIFG